MEINSDYNPIVRVSWRELPLLDLINWIWRWVRCIRHVIWFTQPHNWPESPQPFVSRLVESYPYPLSPAIGDWGPWASIVLHLNRPNYASIEICSNRLILEGCQFFKFTPITVPLCDLCATRLPISYWFVIGHQLGRCCSSYIFGEHSVLVVNQIVNRACARELTATSCPS